MNVKLLFIIVVLSALSLICYGSIPDASVAGGQCPAQEPIHGKALQYYTFKTLPVSSPFGCLYHCHYEVRCQSYNYVINKNICEMNNRTKEANPRQFVSDPARFYTKRGAHRVSLGSTPALPAESCAEIKANEAGEAVSGNFWLDLQRTGAATLAYCDMSTEDNKKNFGVIVKTANVWLAGTDAFLYLQLIGSNKKRSGESKVGTEDGSHDDFEKGATDSYTVAFNDVGIISRLKIKLVENPEKTFAGGWTMAEIVIKDLSRQNVYSFSGPEGELDVYPGQTRFLNARAP